MQTLFNQEHLLSRVVSQDSNWNYVKAGLQRNLQTIRDYYSIRPFAVKSNHLIARLVNTLGVSHDQSTERFYDIVDAKALNLGMHFKMTSSIYRGELFDGVFYGPGCKEIIFANNDYVNPFEVTRNWKTVSPVTVLCHPRSDLECLLPTGRQNTTEQGFAAISINIPMLALQFRAFAKEQYERSLSDGVSPLAVSNFVHMYVLPGMMSSHLDHVLFNRAFNQLMGLPMGTALKRHRFPVIDYSNKLNGVIKETTKKLQTDERSYADMLRSFPCVSAKSFYELMRLPEQAETRQIQLAEIVTRLKAVDWLSTLSPSHGAVINGADNNLIMKAFEKQNNAGGFRQFLDSETYVDTIRLVRDISSKIAPGRDTFYS